MKNFKVFAMSLLAAGAFSLASCSSSDELGGDTNKSEVVAGTQYVSVKIVTNSGSGSRADDGTYSAGKGTYEDGTEAESTVSKIRFYLFNEDGTAYMFKSVTTGDTETTASVAHNWVDITPDMASSGAAHGETVEAQTEATLIMKGTTTTSPKKIVAVANVTFDDTEDGKKDYTLDELSKVVADYSASAKAGDFVMSNSVYLKDGAVVNYASLDGKVFAEENKDKALSNPATIYIERALAKVNTTLDTEKYDNKNITKTKVGTLTDGKSVYAKVLGWKVTTEAQTSYLLKNINTTWTDEVLSFNTTTGPWNSADYHRSYWASNPTGLTFGYHTYKAIKEHTTGTPLYTQENADIVNTDNATKVIVAAQLVDSVGEAIELCKFGGNEYVGESSVRTQILNVYKNLGYWKKVGNEYKTLEDADFTLEYIPANGKEYKLKAVLVDNLGLYTKSGETYTAATKDNIDKKMLDYPVTVAKTGYVYYFTEINHLNSKPGVVRNHSYQLNIQDIKGFGTPVYDPESKREIDPVVPEDDPKTYMAAQCKILSWRIVKSNVNLDKTQKK